MVARIALFLSLVLITLFLIIHNLPKKEKVVFEVPPGYGRAQKIEVAPAVETTAIPSALDYANAFAQAPEVPAKVIAAAPAPKPVLAKKHVKAPKRHLARAKGKRNVFLAKR